MKNIKAFIKTIGVQETNEEMMKDPRFKKSWLKSVKNQITRAQNQQKDAIRNMSAKEKDALSAGAYYYDDDYDVVRPAAPGTSKKYNV